MTDYEVYKTKAEAEAELAALRGWPDACVVEMLIGDDDVWVLQCAGDDESGKFLRSDGYVR